MWHAQRCIYYIWGVHSFHLTMNNSCPAVGQLSLSATGAASAAAAASRASAVHLLVNIFISVALWADSVTLPPRHRRRVWETERERPRLNLSWVPRFTRTMTRTTAWSAIEAATTTRRTATNEAMTSTYQALPPLLPLSLSPLPLCLPMLPYRACQRVWDAPETPLLFA